LIMLICYNISNDISFIYIYIYKSELTIGADQIDTSVYHLIFK
jgi:hypothetical protein